MDSKLVVITVELVDESVEEKAEIIQGKILEWFEENSFSIPWVKRLKGSKLKKA